MLSLNKAVVTESSGRFKGQDWQQLIDAAREGCDVALGEIFSRTRGYLLLVANHRLDSGLLHAKFGASDVVQQTQMEAYEKFDQFCGGSEAEYRAWIKRIVVNNVIDASKRYTNTQSRDCCREVPIESSVHPFDVLQLTASTIMSRRESDHELERAIRKLSPRQQQVIRLKHRFGYGYAEIAIQLQISESAVRLTWSRAINHLKNLLANSGA